MRHKHYSQEQGLQWLIHMAKGLKYLHTARPMASSQFGTAATQGPIAALHAGSRV